MHKLAGEISVCEEIDLPSPEGAVRFSMVSCVCHYGQSPHDGHYISFRKDASGNWWRCDDRNVTWVGLFSTARPTFEKYGYMFVFCKKDSS